MTFNQKAAEIIAIARRTGRRYPELERRLHDVHPDVLRDLRRLLDDVREEENRRCRSQASRMGLPGIIR